MSQTARSVVVIGGGVIGAACAHYLSRAGWSVTIVDSGQFGMGCSHANCGFVCPSHVLPLALPGAIRGALKAMLNPNGPFRIKPRLDLALWRWLYRFACRCNRDDMLAAGHSIQALLNSSRQLYAELVREERLDCEWQTRGLLFVFRTASAFEHFAETDKLLSEHFNIPAKPFAGEAVTALEPALKPGLAGGWLYENDAHLRPDRLLSSWQSLLTQRGVQIRENCPVHGLTSDVGLASSVNTPQGPFRADAFVFATGAWTPLLNEHLGCRVPIQPGKGYSITMPRPRQCPQVPMVFEEHRVAVTPMETGFRLGSMMEFAGYDTSLNPRRLDMLRDAARVYLHEPLALPTVEEWYGWRPMTPDSIPIIDRSPKYANVWIAAGHNMLGVSMAPATGKLIAALLSGEAAHLDPAPYSLRRFHFSEPRP